MAKPAQHDDFGVKIGGAKKDLWQQRGLLSGDLEDMNSREADKFVKKDNVWKKPDYQAMIEDGLPVDVAFFIKKVRDSLPASPQYYRADDTPEKRLARQKQYVDTVRLVQNTMEQVKTKADALNAFEKCMFANGYFERVKPGISSYYASPTEKGRENPAITDKLAKTLFVRSEMEFQYDYTNAAERQQFGVPKEQKVPNGYDIRFNDGKNSYSKGDDWKPNTFYVTRQRRILKVNIESREVALKWAQEHAQQRGASGKKRFVPPQLAHIRRTGPDYRHGRDASGQHYLDTFGFRGGEFGNWMSQKDRQASLNMGFDALKDLADALKISDKDISFQGGLAIAFGARGSGSAVAHYEPTQQVINLTKMRGAGSLGHEWWHGLDDHLGQRAGANGLLSENIHKSPMMKKLVDTIKYKPESPEQAAQRAAKQDATTHKAAGRWLDEAVLYSLQRSGNEQALSSYETLKAAYLKGEAGSVEKISALKKEVSGHIIPKEARQRLILYEDILHGMATGEKQPPTVGKVFTDYYTNSKRMGELHEKDGGYWESNTELTARAFATYVMDKLPTRSDYLVGHAEYAVNIDTDADGKTTILKAYPEGEERAAINAVFDELVADLKLQQVFTHDDRPAPIAPERPQHDFDAAPQVGEQLSFADNMAKPSVLGQLAATKADIKAPDPKTADRVPEKDPSL